MIISVESKGSFSNMERFLDAMKTQNIFQGLERFAQQGVAALAAATPVESGETRDSWSYEIHDDGRAYSIVWTNSHMAGKAPVVVLLQYGHGTGTGGYVEGIDIVNPPMKPLFDQIANEAWKVVTTK